MKNKGQNELVSLNAVPAATILDNVLAHVWRLLFFSDVSYLSPQRSLSLQGTTCMTAVQLVSCMYLSTKMRYLNERETLFNGPPLLT